MGLPLAFFLLFLLLLVLEIFANKADDYNYRGQKIDEIVRDELVSKFEYLLEIDAK